MAIHTISCETLEAFSSRLQQLHQVGFVNAGHHAPHRLNRNEYLICTHRRCRRCANSTGLSIVWHEGSATQGAINGAGYPAGISSDYSRWPRKAAGTASS